MIAQRKKTTEQRLQQAIMQTPTGPARNTLTEINLLLMSEGHELKASHAELLVACEELLAWANNAARDIGGPLSFAKIQSAVANAKKVQP